jgi:hypothetical protein
MEGITASSPEEKALLEKLRKNILEVDRQHRERARTMSELCNKLLQKRRAKMPINYDEFLQDIDVIKRTSEHIGACQGMNELKLIVWPEEVQPPT